MSNINVDLFYFINHNLQNPFLDWIMILTTHLGGFVSLCAILVLIIILSTIFKKKNIRNIAALCLVALLVADGIALVLKNWVAEPRPFITLDNVRLLIVEDDPMSFPSGHTTSTCAVLFALIFKYKNKLLTIVLAICCFLVGFSRIYVGVHYPLDILSGAIIGILSAYFVYRYWDEIIMLFNKIKGSVS